MKQHKRFIMALVALMTLVTGAWAADVKLQSAASNYTIQMKVGNGEYADLTTSGTTVAGGQTVYLKIQASSGYYMEESDISILESIGSGMAQAPRRRTAPTVSVVSFSLSSGTTTDLTGEHVYTFTMPSTGCNVTVNATAHARTTITEGMISAIADQTFTGVVIQILPTVTSGSTLTKDTDYTLSWGENTNVATGGTVTVTGINKFTGSAAKTFDIVQAALTITAKAQTITYGGSIATGVDQVDVTGLVGGDELTAITLTPSTSDVTTTGTIAPAAATTSKGASNYTITYNTGNLTINKATPAYTAPTAKTLTYTGAAQELINAGSTSDGTIYYQLGSGEWTTSIPTSINSGEYTVNWKLTGDANHSDVSSTVVSGVAIAKKAITVSDITASNKTYDGSNSATLDCSSATFTGIVGGDNLTVTATGTFENATAGDGKTVNISGLTLGGTCAANYILAVSGQQASTTANITKAVLTATADNKTRAYNVANPELTVIVTGFVNSETTATAAGYSAPTATTTATQSSAVGDYDITVSGGAATNYSFKYVSGTLTITAATATITAEATQSKDYNGASQALDATVSAGSITITYWTNAERTEGKTTTAPTNAGTYYATVTQSNNDYSSEPVQVTYTINKVSLSMVTIADIADQVIESGWSATPAFTVTIGENAVDAGEYTASWTNNDKAGTATLTLTSQNVNFTDGTTQTKNFTIKRRLNITLNGTTQKWASYYAAEDLAVPAGAKAYRVSVHTASSVTVEEVDYIKANTGVLLQADAEVSGTALEVAAGSGTSYESQLAGSVTATTMTDGTNYILYNGAFVLAEGTSLAANRCYLHVEDAVSPARELQIVFDATGISHITTDLSEVEGAWYTVDGRKLQGKPTVKGLYIVNGKKVVVK